MRFQGLDGKIHILFYLKDDEYGWMSNFFPCQMFVDKKDYPTVEHYYQSKKAVEPRVERWIASAPKPYLAMMAGRGLRPHEFRADWESIKTDVMRMGLYAKFMQDIPLRRKLLETGDAILQEDSPTDMFWGMRGKDMLGKLLMETRERIRGIGEM